MKRTHGASQSIQDDFHLQIGSFYDFQKSGLADNESCKTIAAVSG